MVETDYQGEEFIFSKLGLLQDLVQGTEVGLNPSLDILVHAGLSLGVLGAPHKGLDLGDVCKAGEDELVLDLGRESIGNLVTGFDIVKDPVLEPVVLEVQLLHRLLLGVEVQLVVLVQHTNLTENTGHVSDLGGHLVLLLFHLLSQTVSDIESVGKSGGLSLTSLKSKLP